VQLIEAALTALVGDNYGRDLSDFFKVRTKWPRRCPGSQSPMTPQDRAQLTGLIPQVRRRWKLTCWAGTLVSISEEGSTTVALFPPRHQLDRTMRTHAVALAYGWLGPFPGLRARGCPKAKIRAEAIELDPMLSESYVGGGWPGILIGTGLRAKDSIRPRTQPPFDAVADAYGYFLAGEAAS